MNSILRIPAALLLSVLAACTSSDPKKENGSTQQKGSMEQTAGKERTGSMDAVVQWTFSRTSGSRLEFTNGKGIDTKLENPEYIGQLSNGTKAPYLIYAGLSSGDRWIYLYSPDQPPTQKRVRYGFPHTSRLDGRVTFRSRAFAGQVLDDREGLIYYQEQILDDNTPRKTAFSVRVEAGALKHTFAEPETISETLRLLKAGKCIELKSETFSMVSAPAGDPE